MRESDPLAEVTRRERLAQLSRLHALLKGCADVPELLARAAALAAEVCGFDRAVVLGVADGRLTAQDSGVLADRDSDLMRRAVLAEPVPIAPGSPESAVVRGDGPLRGSGTEAGPLASRLALHEHLLVGVAPDAWVVALLVLDRQGPVVGDDDAALAAVFAMVLGMELERVVQRARATDLAEELRQHQAASQALAREMLEGSASLPSVSTGSPFFQFDAPATLPADSLAELLTPAETRVAALLARGRSNRQIADELILSPETVKTHVANVLRKVGASNRAEAVYRLIELSRAG